MQEPERNEVSPNSHLVRLALVAACGAIGFLVLRSLMVPESFGADGHYRAAAIDEIVAREPLYMGSGTCGECHKKRQETHAGGKHAPVACETCHGPARGHLTMDDSERVKLEVDRSPELCLGCHAKLVGRPARFKQIELARHREDQGFAEGDACVDCHDVHDPSME